MAKVSDAPLKMAPSFPELVASAHGRHPIEILDALRLDASATARRLMQEACSEPMRSMAFAQGAGLSLPHPLDVEWRFTDEAAADLLAGAVASTRAGDAILLFGVPTVVLAALRNLDDRRFVIVNEDNIIGAELVARFRDDKRFTGAPPNSCQAAILDPPWYPAVFVNLLARAATWCQAGARLFVSAPPIGVRPTSALERQDALASAARAGLTFLEGQAESLSYRTPAFEAAAMGAAGITMPLPAWRRGDFLMFTKRVSGEPADPIAARAPSFELTLEGVRLRLLAIPATSSNAIEPLVSGEIFPSVSNRALGRHRANLWTSGNRAYICPPAQTLLAMQRLAAERGLWPKGLSPQGTDGVDLTGVDPIHLIEELARIAARDLSHTAMLVGETSWNRASNDARFLNNSASTFQKALLGTPD